MSVAVVAGDQKYQELVAALAYSVSLTIVAGAPDLEDTYSSITDIVIALDRNR